MVITKIITSVFLTLLTAFSLAQVDTNSMEYQMRIHPDMDMSGMDMGHGKKMDMGSSYSRNLTMNRDGSGTSWQPDESPMAMYMLAKNNTTLMWHGAFFLRATAQDVFHKSNRGGTQVDGPNWFMFMLNQKAGKHGVFNFSSMFSLDLLTEVNGGYPLLFQSGENYKGVPLVDKQHPHDLFAGLSVAYTQSFTNDIDLTAYFGYPGEPALGPVAFMHRLSAINDPDAPIAHHWQDASHITFGVGTIAFRYKFLKAEGSIFTGREPDAIRYDFDKPRFDSYSYRISENPGKNFSIQFSQGFIHSPEQLQPDINVIRTTASISNVQTFSKDRFIATSAVWGYNHFSNRQNLHSLLLESNLKLQPCSVYMRYEWAQKDADELQFTSAFASTTVFNINAITLGVSVPLVTKFNTQLSFGGQTTLNIPDAQLRSYYGNLPVGMEMFLRLAPAFHKMMM